MIHRHRISATENRDQSDTSTLVTLASGPSAETSDDTDTGTLKQAWSFVDVQYQLNASGTPVGTVTTTSDVGSDTETEVNGTVNDPGATDVQTSTTTNAGSTPPTAPPIANPGDLLAAEQNNNGNQNGNSAPAPSENAIQQVIAGLQWQIQAYQKQVALAQAKAATAQAAWTFGLGQSAANQAAIANAEAYKAYAAPLIAVLQAKIETERATLEAMGAYVPPSTIAINQLEVVDVDAAGYPGFWTGIIPVYGSSASSAAALSEGTWIGAAKGVGYFGLAVSDIFLLRSVGTAILAKGGPKLLAQEAVVNSADDAATATAEVLAKEGCFVAGTLVHISSVADQSPDGRNEQFNAGEQRKFGRLCNLPTGQVETEFVRILELSRRKIDKARRRSSCRDRVRPHPRIEPTTSDSDRIRAAWRTSHSTESPQG